MKFFNVLAFVCLFFFLIGCEDSPQRLIPIDEPDDGNSEITDDSDNPDTTYRLESQCHRLCGAF